MSKRDQLNAEISRRVVAEEKARYATEVLDRLAGSFDAAPAPPPAPAAPAAPPLPPAPPAPPPSLTPTWDEYRRRRDAEGQYAGSQWLLNQDARTLSAETAARLAAGPR